MRNNVNKIEFSDRIYSLFGEERYADARRLLMRQLGQHPDDHWLLTRLSTTYYEERDYEKALRMAQKAYDLAPKCPQVVWDYAGALSALGKADDAIILYDSLIRRGQRSIAHEECGEGMEWADSLVTDCWYRLGLCHESNGDKKKASACFWSFLDRIEVGSESLYNRTDALRHLKNSEVVNLRIELKAQTNLHRIRDIPRVESYFDYLRRPQLVESLRQQNDYTWDHFIKITSTDSSLTETVQIQSESLAATAS
jgi:Tetratricopeptide repeat